MSNKLSGTLTLRLPSGDNRFKAFFNVGESGFATEEYVKQLIAELENKEYWEEYVKKTDIQDTLNSDNSNKPLSAKQGKILKKLLDNKVIEAGSVPIDTEPIEGNITHLVNSDGLAKEFNKYNTEIILGGIYDVSAHNERAVFESLQDLLSSSNLSTLIPQSVRHGGMIIRFIQGSEQSSNNKYIQYRLTANSWSTTPSDWQGVDDEPTVGSDNLVKSGGVANSITELKLETIGQTKTSIKNATINGNTGQFLQDYEGASACSFNVLPDTKYFIYADGELVSSCRVAFYQSEGSGYGADFISGKNTSESEIITPSNCTFCIVSMITAIKNEYSLFLEGSLNQKIEDVKSSITDLSYKVTSLEDIYSNPSDNIEFNKVVPELYISPDNTFTYDIPDSISVTVGDNMRQIWFIKDGVRLNAFTLKGSDGNGVYKLTDYIYICLDNVTKNVFATSLTKKCSVLDLNPRIKAYINSSNIQAAVDIIPVKVNEEIYKNPTTDTKLNRVLKEIYFNTDLAEFNYSAIKHIHISTDVIGNYVQFWFYDSNNNYIIRGTLGGRYGVYKLATGVYAYIDTTNLSGVNVKNISINDNCTNIIYSPHIHAYLNSERITDINEKISKIFAPTNNILWLGTSITEGCKYPKEASAANGYNGINHGVSASGIRFIGQRPSGTVTWYSGLSLTARQSELEALFREDVNSGAITEEIMNMWKNRVSYEGSVIPHINGTDPLQVSMIIIEHGYNDRGVILEQLANIDSIDWDSEDRKTFTGAFRFLLNRIQEVNPYVRVVIGGYFSNTIVGTKDSVTGAINSMYGKEVCYMQELVAKHYNLPILKTWENSQISSYYVSGTNDYIAEYNQTYDTSYNKLLLLDEERHPIENNGLISSLQLSCPDGVHPSSDKSGECDKRLNAVYTKALNKIL